MNDYRALMPSFRELLRNTFAPNEPFMPSVEREDDIAALWRRIRSETPEQNRDPVHGCPICARSMRQDTPFLACIECRYAAVVLTCGQKLAPEREKIQHDQHHQL